MNIIYQPLHPAINDNQGELKLHLSVTSPCSIDEELTNNINNRRNRNTTSISASGSAIPMMSKRSQRTTYNLHTTAVAFAALITIMGTGGTGTVRLSSAFVIPNLPHRHNYHHARTSSSTRSCTGTSATKRSDLSTSCSSSSSSSSSSSYATKLSPIEATLLSSSSQLTSFLPFGPLHHENNTSFINGKIVSRSRYGGRSSSLPIIVNTSTTNTPLPPLSSSSVGQRNVLGFDLKMVSPSIEESNNDTRTSSRRRTRRSSSSNNNKDVKSESNETMSSSSSPTKQNHHDFRGTIGIDTWNQQKASPIKKQIVSNLLLQSYHGNNDRYFGLATTSSSGSGGNSASTTLRQKESMNPFHFDPDELHSSSFGGNIDDLSASTAATSSRTKTILDKEKNRKSTSRKNNSNIGGRSCTKTNVPMWFPYIPNRQQIESLKIIELKDVCEERGLIKSGNKQELQQRLFEWTLDQHKRRVLERNARRSTTSRPLHDAINQAIHPPTSFTDTSISPISSENESFDSFLSSSFDSFSAASALNAKRDSKKQKSQRQKEQLQFPGSKIDRDEEIDTIEPLINRRKQLLRSKQFSFSKNKKKGVLGFEVDELNISRHEDDEDDDEEEEYYDDMDEYMSSKLSNAAYLSDLTKTFHESKSVSRDSSKDELEIGALNNYQLNEMYLQAKYADQGGDSDAAKNILQRLLQVTPNDSRVIRRLARLYIQENDFHRGRQILQSGLQNLPNDVYLLQGLGQLERNCGNLMKARDYFKQAIQSSPEVPNPYHALGTLEHSQGNIKAATTVLRMGLKYCPSNHRLHHALGDLYREAKMLDMAKKAYLKGLKCLDIESERSGRQMDWSRSFFYSAMSYLSYDLDDKAGCRNWLKKSIDQRKNKLHSQGWLGLAQLEESEGNIDNARDIYHKGLNVYEKHRGIRKLKTSSRSMLGNIRGNRLQPSKLGDRWLSVYESLARFEEEYGDYNSANNVYSRAATAFPLNWNILISWSKLQMKYKKYDRARTLLELACIRAGKSDSEPVRIFAEFEMSMKNFVRARSILFNGAQSCSESSDGSLHNSNLSRLYHTWAICEWHMGNLDRAEVLFDHSLRVTDAESEGSEMRALILLSITRFLFHARKDLSLAQHCISLSLAENTKSHISWILWAKIAEKMGNEALGRACRKEATKIQGGEKQALPSVKNSAINQMLRRSPWHHKIFNIKELKSWYELSTFPDSINNELLGNSFSDPSLKPIQ